MPKLSEYIDLEFLRCTHHLRPRASRQINAASLWCVADPSAKCCNLRRTSILTPLQVWQSSKVKHTNTFKRHIPGMLQTKYMWFLLHYNAQSIKCFMMPKMLCCNVQNVIVLPLLCGSHCCQLWQHLWACSFKCGWKRKQGIWCKVLCFESFTYRYSICRHKLYFKRVVRSTDELLIFNAVLITSILKTTSTKTVYYTLEICTVTSLMLVCWSDSLCTVSWMNTHFYSFLSYVGHYSMFLFLCRESFSVTFGKMQLFISCILTVYLLFTYCISSPLSDGGCWQDNGCWLSWCRARQICRLWPMIPCPHSYRPGVGLWLWQWSGIMPCMLVVLPALVSGSLQWLSSRIFHCGMVRALLFLMHGLPRLWF